MGRDSDEEEDWEFICEHSLLANRLNQLDEIYKTQFNGNSNYFVHGYLSPVVELLDSIRNACEEYYGSKRLKDDESSWSTRFENIVKYAIHPYPLETKRLHKGDFYIYISETTPRVLELNYQSSKGILTRELSRSDSVLMCSENWTELLCSESSERFIYTSCIIWTNNKFEKVKWNNLVQGYFIGNQETPSKDEGEDDGSIYQQPDDIDVPIEMEDILLKQLCILDLNFELLHSQVLYAPGSRDKRGGPVIFFNTNKDLWESMDYVDEDLTKLLFYFHKIPIHDVQSKGCSVVIDARDNTYSLEVLESIGKALTLLQHQLPGSIYKTYLLTKKDSLMLLYSSSKFKSKVNFEFQLFSSMEKLKQLISVDYLPENLEGMMKYGHDEWIKFRTKVEPFMAGCRSAAKQALRCMQSFNQKDLGINAADSKQLLDQHLKQCQEVFEDSRLIALRVEGKQIIDHLRDDKCVHSEDYVDTMDCVNRLYNQMIQVFDKLHLIAERRTSELQLCNDVRSFEEDSDKVLNWVQNEGLPYFDKHPETSDTLDSVQSLMDNFMEFQALSEDILADGERNFAVGGRLLEGGKLKLDEYLIEEKLKDLEGSTTLFTFQIKERKRKLDTCLEFHKSVEGINQWWMLSLSYIAHMDMEQIQTIEGIGKLKQSILQFKEDHPPYRDSQIARVTELAHYLGTKQVEQAEQVSCRSREVQEMLQVKQNQLLGAEGRFQQARLDSSFVDDTDDASSGIRDDDLSTEADQDEDEPLTSPTELVRWNQLPQLYDENDSNLAVYDAGMATKVKERLKFIINEMISTEYEYVQALNYVIENYMPCMDASVLPPTLMGKKNVIFGNLERIYDFHKRFFSQEIEAYRHAPLQIGKCFLKWERQFYLYALYNKNKPKSDLLWNDFANSYFLAKMLEMKDKLDLASYLIKPVQRLGKYALLLKDVINCCDPRDPRVVEIKAAHELMKFQLRHGNDLLAMDSICQSDVNLKEQGCLLRQADFIVSYGKKKYLRRVFLFEQVLVFTKAKKQKTKADVFTYKHSIKMVDLGLTENIGESGLRFEVWYRRWKKGKAGDSFVLQATSDNVKKCWVDEITRILWRQAARNKEYGLTEASTGISVESTPSSVFLESDENVYNDIPLSPLPNERLNDNTTNRMNDVSFNKKRLSWLSVGDSSNSSGVFDLGSLPEDGPIRTPAVDDSILSKRVENDIKYYSLRRKKHSHQANSGNSSFIRNNVYRKTYQVEMVKLDRQGIASSRNAVRRNSVNIIDNQPTQFMKIANSSSYTEGLDMAHRTSKVSRDRSFSPNNFMEEIREDSIIVIQNTDLPDTLSKSITDSRVEYGEARPKIKLLTRSSTESNISTKRHISRSASVCGDMPNFEIPKSVLRRYSFHNAIKKDNKINSFERFENMRVPDHQRSVSSSDVYAGSSTGRKKLPVNNGEKTTASKKNIFQTLKAKISKSSQDL